MSNTIKKRAKKRKVIISPQGIAHVKASFNNLLVTVTNPKGDTIAWSSAGKQGFKGAKKSTPFAARQAAQACAQTAYDLGLRKVEVYTKGIGPSKEHAIRGLSEIGLEVKRIQDITPRPHNGCRPPKKRHP